MFVNNVDSNTYFVSNFVTAYHFFLQECLPVINHTLASIESVSPNDSGVIIIDLCSGFGYLSMILSDILPADKVKKIVLIDKMFPFLPNDHSDPSMLCDKRHINWTHIVGRRWKQLWPIPLECSKQDIKKGSALSFIGRVYLQHAPVFVLAVHLCGTLSIRACDIFNNNPNTVSMIALKPCCLPDILHVKRDEIFTSGGHSFSAREVFFTMPIPH